MKEPVPASEHCFPVFESWNTRIVPRWTPGVVDTKRACSGERREEDEGFLDQVTRMSLSRIGPRLDESKTGKVEERESFGASVFVADLDCKKSVKTAKEG